MSNQDSLVKLVNIVNEQLKQGRSEDEVVSTLISLGLDDAKAKHVVTTVKASRTSHVSGIVRFMVIIFASLFAVGLIVYIALGETQLVAQVKWMTLMFFFSFILFGIMSGIKGKLLAYARVINAGVWLTSSFMLMVAMFLHPGWENTWFGTGGGWRGQIVTFIGNLIYNIGSTGIAFILLCFTMLIAFFFLAEVYRLTTRDYE